MAIRRHKNSPTAQHVVKGVIPIDQLRAATADRECRNVISELMSAVDVHDASSTEDQVAVATLVSGIARNYLSGVTTPEQFNSELVELDVRSKIGKAFPPVRTKVRATKAAAAATPSATPVAVPASPEQKDPIMTNETTINPVPAIEAVAPATVVEAAPVQAPAPVDAAIALQTAHTAVSTAFNASQTTLMAALERLCKAKPEGKALTLTKAALAASMREVNAFMVATIGAMTIEDTQTFLAEIAKETADTAGAAVEEIYNAMHAAVEAETAAAKDKYADLFGGIVKNATATIAAPANAKPKETIEIGFWKETTFGIPNETIAMTVFGGLVAVSVYHIVGALLKD